MISNQERYEAAVECAKELVLLASEVFGDWQSTATGAVAAYYEVIPEDRDGWLDYGIECSAETKLAWDSMLAVASYLMRNDDVMPRNLALWVADVLDGKRTRPKVAARSTWSRDIALAGIVDIIVENCDLHPTRNDGSEEHSACDAVGAAVNRSYKTVEAAWLQKRRFVS